jgi:ComF family protein
MAFINDFMSLIYPRRCEACGNALYQHEEFICSFCHVSLPRSNYHLLPENEILRLLAGRVPLKHASSVFVYEKKGRVQGMLHAIKYQDQKELGAYLGRLYASGQSEKEVFKGVDVIVPIPLHRKKLRSRGYNQSEWFARGLSEALEKPLDTSSLVRVAHTATQTRKKKYERWENVEGIFKLLNPGAFAGRHVLLVDDVITTGATIEAAWLALQGSASASLSVLSIAFATKAG